MTETKETSASNQLPDEVHSAEKAALLQETASEANDLQTQLLGWFNSIWAATNGSAATPCKPLVGSASSAWLLGVPYTPLRPPSLVNSTPPPSDRKEETPLETPAVNTTYPGDGSESPNQESAVRVDTQNPALSLEEQKLHDQLLEKKIQRRPLPEDFYLDFYSRIWASYRTNFSPIRPSTFTRDVGWGCMLRSGQSLLAQALLFHFLGRSWRRVGKSEDDRWRKYARIIVSILDEFSARSPFAIHKIALLGKQYDKEIGQWFGPSTISQVIKVLVLAEPDIGMAVYVATDGVVYRDEVAKACAKIADADSSKTTEQFRPVLILISIRLGTDKLNPVYHEALKAYLTFPQTVGIAGGRTDSSLYFIGYEGDQLFYLDPHYARPAIETKQVEDYDENDPNSCVKGLSIASRLLIVFQIFRILQVFIAIPCGV